MYHTLVNRRSRSAAKVCSDFNFLLKGDPTRLDMQATPQIRSVAMSHSSFSSLSGEASCLKGWVRAPYLLAHAWSSVHKSSQCSRKTHGHMFAPVQVCTTLHIC